MKELKGGKMSEDTINIKKDQLWKYSTILLLAVVVIGGFMLFSGNNSPTGSVVRDTDFENRGDFQKLSVNYVDLVGNNGVVLGPKDAPVTIVEFSDYFCGFCQRHHLEVFPLIKENYVDSGSVNYVTKDFLRVTPNAAEFARCINEVGGENAYWDANNLLFNAGPNSVNEILFAEIISTLDIDSEKVNSCIESGKYLSQIQRSTTIAQDIGIQGTPGFLILMQKENADIEAIKMSYFEQGGAVYVQPVETKDGNYVGVRIGGALPYEYFEKAIEAGL